MTVVVVGDEGAVDGLVPLADVRALALVDIDFQGVGDGAFMDGIASSLLEHGKKGLDLGRQCVPLSVDQCDAAGGHEPQGGFRTPFADPGGAIEVCVEILDDVQMRAVNVHSKLNYPELTTLFFEFHGSEHAVKEQIATVGDLARANGGGEFYWSNLAEERAKLWKARHQAFYAAIAMRKGCIGWPTDVCVPIGRLAECINETKKDLEKASFPAPILGHVGDGNFHVIFVIDPNKPEEQAEAEALNERLVARALSMDGTCTGEHGIGLGKQDWLVRELGEDGVDMMRTIKRALDPKNLFNPGKIFAN